MDPFTARMLERARDRQRRVDGLTAAPAPAAPAPARSPLRSGAAGNSEPGIPRRTEKSSSPRRPAADRPEDKENRPNVLHASTRSRLKQLGSLYSTDGDTDPDAYDVEVTPRHSRPEPEPPSRPLTASCSSSSAGLRSRLAGLASQYHEIEAEEMQGFTPSGSRTRLVYDFAGPSRSPSPPRVVSAVTKPPSPAKTAGTGTALPYRSASPVRYSPPPRPQPSSPTGVPYGAPPRDASPLRHPSPSRHPSPVRGRLVQERAAVFDRPASPPPPDVDPTEMKLADRRKLFEKGQAPKVIARFGTPVTPHMLRQHAATSDGPSQPPAPAVPRPRPAEGVARPRPALEETRSRSPLRQAAAPAGPPSPSRPAGASTVQTQRRLWEAMNSDWKEREIAQNSRQERERELGVVANRWQHRREETMDEMEVAAPPVATAPSGGIPPPPPPPPPPPASPPSRRAGGDGFTSPSRQAPPAASPARHSPARHSPVHHSPTRNSPVHHSTVHHSPVHHSPGVHHSPVHHNPAQRSSSDYSATRGMGVTETQSSSAESGSSPGSTVYRGGSTAADESTVSYASGQSEAESLGAEILAMARANQQQAPGLPTIDESSADSSSDLSSMAACAAIDDVLDDIDNGPEEPTPPKRTRTTMLRRCVSQPYTSSSASAASISDASEPSHTTADTSSQPTTPSTAATTTSVSPSVAQLIRHFQRPPALPVPPPRRQRRSAPCLGAYASAVGGGVSGVVRTSTPRRAGVGRGGGDGAQVLPELGRGLELELDLEMEEEKASGSTETLTGTDLANVDTGKDALTSKQSDTTANSTPVLTNLTFDLTDPPQPRPDLTFDLASPAPLSADLGAVSWTGRSPRCWEEPSDQEGATGGQTRGMNSGSRLRQYLFGTVKEETAAQAGVSQDCTDSQFSFDGHRDFDGRPVSGEETDTETDSKDRPRDKVADNPSDRESISSSPFVYEDSEDEPATDPESPPPASHGAEEGTPDKPRREVTVSGMVSGPEAGEGSRGKPHREGTVSDMVSGPEAGEGSPDKPRREVTVSDMVSGPEAGEGSRGKPHCEGTVSDMVSRLEAVCLRSGGGDGEMAPCRGGVEEAVRGRPPAGARSKRQDSGVFRTPMACVRSPEQDPSLPSVVLDGDGEEMPLMHSVSFYRKQKPQEVRVTPVRPVVRNREIAAASDDTSYSGSRSAQQPVGASTQERIKHLQNEAAQQMTVMSQASRALNLCNATIEFTGSAEMVEAERLLLVATHRRQAALSEIQRLKTEGAMRQQGILRPASRGSLSVSSVTLPVKTSFVREVAAGAANYVYYFVVLLRYRGQVIATQMLSSEDSIKGNAINFPNLVSFRDLEAEFCVALEVYGLQTQREVLPHDAKYHIRKDRTKTPKKLLKHQSSLTSPAVQSPAGPGAVRATCFQLMGFIHLTARNLTNSAWALEKVPSQSPLDGGVLMTVTCHADCSIEERGFITVFDDVSGFGAWHRRWAVLAAGRLSFWRYPEDEGRLPPSAEVDLRRCVTERVGAVPRDICARQNTLLLVTVREARKEDEDSLVMQRRGTMTRIRHLLSLDGRDERQLWADKLNETLADIRAWDPDAMQPHLDPSA